MLGLLTRSRPRPAPRSHSVRLALERLEGRDLMTAPSITSFAAVTLPGHVIQLSGTLMDEHPATVRVTFGGAVSGFTTADSTGHFIYSTKSGSLGVVQAVGFDDEGLSSNVANATVLNAPPTIVSFDATEGPGGYWTFSGRVSDDTPAGATVTFGGLPELAGQPTTVNSDGTFSITVQLAPGESGMVTAQATDVWGQKSNVVKDLVT